MIAKRLISALQKYISNAFDGRIILIIAIGLASATIMLIMQREVIWNAYAFSHDQNMHVYWMQIFRNPEMFQNDYLTAYTMRCAPWGYQAFYWLMSRLVDPVWLSSVLPIFLSAITSILFFLYFEKISGFNAAVIATAIVMGEGVILCRMFGGTPRAFAWPLIALMLYGTQKKNPIYLMLAFVGMAGFYPIVFVLCCSAYLLAVMIRYFDKNTENHLGKNKMVLLAMIISFGLIISQQVYLHQFNYGGALKAAEVKSDRFFHKWSGGNRDRLLPQNSYRAEVAVRTWYFRIFNQNIVSRMSDRTTAFKIRKQMMTVNLCMIIFLSCFIAVIYFRKKIPAPYELYTLMFSGFVLFCIAQASGWRLYHPARYVNYSSVVLVIWTTSVITNWMIEKIPIKIWKNTARVVLVICMIMLVTQIKGSFQYNATRSAEFYRYIHSLPQDSMIAAYPPSMANSVPLLAGRKVYISDTLTHPYHREYFKEVKKRQRRIISATYAKDPQVIIRFMEENEIDYMMVDLSCFKSPPKTMKYYNKRLWNKLLLKDSHEQFTIESIDPDKILFRKRNVIVFDSGAFISN